MSFVSSVLHPFVCSTLRLKLPLPSPAFAGSAPIAITHFFSLFLHLDFVSPVHFASAQFPLSSTRKFSSLLHFFSTSFTTPFLPTTAHTHAGITLLHSPFFRSPFLQFHPIVTFSRLLVLFFPDL